MRVLVPSEVPPDFSLSQGQRVELDQKENHHLTVRRVNQGQEVEILDGAGLRATGRLVQSGKRWSVEIQRLAHEPRPASLTLAVAAGDRNRFSWLLEKAAELGVTAVVPLMTSYTAGVATGLKAGHLSGLRRHALEAIKQCGASWVPELKEPVTLEKFLDQRREGVRWLADREGAVPAAVVEHHPMTIVVGPEGGLTEAERSAVLAAGFEAVRLSRYTLRFETAAIAAASAAVLARMRGTRD